MHEAVPRLVLRVGASRRPVQVVTEPNGPLLQAARVDANHEVDVVADSDLMLVGSERGDGRRGATGLLLLDHNTDRFLSRSALQIAHHERHREVTSMHEAVPRLVLRVGASRRPVQVVTEPNGPLLQAARV
eukprot:CAMPEP_0185832348 /NCGR_PEP_ID=MMETSP1353-20130828/2033_1 /TAXON_ID=1077150 /ORGANISM="Erythrolobus australicus, Strain CCMP3124" /LENGTH=130 /DNA_ID=CAMNT_0028530513 /DNA_START=21 /DNA_END=409 /DNA_ORIENTATION=+